MRHLFVLFMALLALSQVNCQQTKPWNKYRDKAVKTERGKLLYNITNLPGHKTLPGEYVIVTVDTYMRDTLVASTRYNQILREVLLPQRKDVNERTPAIYDAAQLMTEGDSAIMWDPLDSLKLSMMPPQFAGETEMRYVIKVHKIISLEEQKQDSIAAVQRFPTVAAQTAQFLADYRSGKYEGKMLVKPSGLKIFIVEPGGPGNIIPGLVTRSHFLGVLPNGQPFDNSFQLGKPITFVPGAGQLIAGYDECVQALKKGGKAYCVVPPALGFGEKGSPNGRFPPNTEAVYYIEVL